MTREQELEIALWEAVNWLHHFREDVRSGVMPYEKTMTNAIDRADAVLKQKEQADVAA